jgi:hypothetical protein
MCEPLKGPVLALRTSLPCPPCPELMLGAVICRRFAPGIFVAAARLSKTELPNATSASGLKKTADGRWPSIGGKGESNSYALEVVAQGKLHDARVALDFNDVAKIRRRRIQIRIEIQSVS